MWKAKAYAICLILFILQQAEASTFIVNKRDVNCSDATGRPFCSIPPAIQKAKPSDTIKIEAGVYHSNIIIDRHLVIVGLGQQKTFLDGGSQASVITVQPGIKLQLKNLAIKNGKSDHGGGIYNQGSLLLDNVILRNNVARQSGGGIYNASSISGSLVIINSLIVANRAEGDDKYNVKFGGGGIYNNAPLIIQNSEINENYAADNGGGIYTVYAGRNKPTSSELISEELGINLGEKKYKSLKRIYDVNAVSIHNSKIFDNRADAGGGVNVHGVLQMSHSVVDGNKADNRSRSSGGGIYAHFDTDLKIDNSTISKNTAKFRGGGLRLYTTRSATIENSTIADNRVSLQFGQGAGLYVIEGTHQFDISASIINGNYANEKKEDCVGDISSRGFNIVSDTDNCNWQLALGDIVNHEMEVKLLRDEQDRQYYLGKNNRLLAEANNFCRLRTENTFYETEAQKQSLCKIGGLAIRD